MADRLSVHDTTIRFRANSMLVASASERARQQGMTMAEYLRHTMRRSLRDAA
ncbi:hypothetical protein [Sphingobium phenoxybenzoativorans]|uniref:hypothetical protein n=1 Tax=Sphingobium phenoxybenzoativorans TaxID=1592790 RepID=UPI001495FBDB|nr:hypothetical protein [Sphingobium phenoxybenzoativorans]